MHAQESTTLDAALQELHLAAVRGYDPNCEADSLLAAVSLYNKSIV